MHTQQYRRATKKCINLCFLTWTYIHHVVLSENIWIQNHMPRVIRFFCVHICIEESLNAVNHPITYLKGGNMMGDFSCLF